MISCQICLIGIKLLNKIKLCLFFDYALLYDIIRSVKLTLVEREMILACFLIWHRAQVDPLIAQVDLHDRNKNWILEVQSSSRLDYGMGRPIYENPEK